MIAAKIIVLCFSSIMQLLTCLSFFSIYGVKRKINLLILYIGYFLFVSVNLISAIFIKQQIVLALFIIFLIGIISLRFEITLSKRLLGVAIISIILIIAEILFGLLFSAIYNLSIVEMQGNIIVFLEVVLFSKLSAYALVRILKAFITRKDESVNLLTLCAFLFLPISTFLALYILSQYVFQSDSLRTQIFAFVTALFLIISNLIVFFIFDLILKHKDKEKIAEAKAMQLEYEKIYYIKMNNAQIESNKALHDLKNKLYAIRALLNSNDTAIHNEISQICGIVQSETPVKVTGIEGVDGLIQMKKKEADKINADFKIISFLNRNEYSISTIDLCVVLGNLIDNALEACMRNDGNSNYIVLEIKELNRYLSILIRNNLSPNRNQNMISKKDSNLHGFGISNVNEIIEKYNGTYNYGIIEEEFIASALIPFSN